MRKIDVVYNSEKFMGLNFSVNEKYHGSVAYDAAFE